MNSQQFAGAVLQLIERTNVSATKGNVQALTAIYQILDSLAQGALILSEPAATVPPKD